MLTIRSIQPIDHPEWRRLRLALWPGFRVSQIDEEIAHYGSKREETVLVAEHLDGMLCGFIEVSLRPFADACTTTPVGYIEGWYVDANVRRQGIGRALVAAAEKWAREQGCLEMGSDCVSNNSGSYVAHQRLGYAPSDKLICFRKLLGPRPHPAEDWIAIVPHELWTMTAVKLVTDPRAGGIDVFLGTTRAEKSPEGRELLALDYEAYEQMALEQMRALAKRAREKWPIVKLALLHRTGRVALGEPSVVIAVSTPHRAQAFEACRFLIDELKRDIAIWKKEVWRDGSETWVHP